MGQEQSTNQQTSRNYNTKGFEQIKNVQKKIEHEGILKLRTTPFPNCIEIDSGASPLFLQNAQTCLQQLLNSRFYTNRLFPFEDIKKLIQNIVYTLAYFEDLGISYKDLSPENIYYCSGQFKLLPNQLIQQSLYERAYAQFYKQSKSQPQESSQFLSLSPQMIIALRYKQKQINDLQLINKSNVFSLGMILLEACTMLPSIECFDSNTYDIFSNIISQRLELVQEHYDVKVVRIIANMIDYDYSQRMFMKDIAIWINRQFSQTSQDRSLGQYQSNTTQKSKQKSQIVKSRVLGAQFLPQLDVNQRFCEDVSATQDNQQTTKNYNRRNLVYINKYNDLKEDSQNIEPEYDNNGPKNHIYLNSRHHIYEPQNNERSKPTNTTIKSDKNYPSSIQQISHQNANNDRSYQNYRVQNKYQPTVTHERYYPRQLSAQVDKPYQYKIGGIKNELYRQNIRQNNRQNNRQNIRQSSKNLGSEDRYLREVRNECPPVRNIQNPYLKSSKTETYATNKQPTKKRFYPSITQLENSYTNSDTKRMNLHSQVGRKRKQVDSINYHKNNEQQFDSRKSESKSINDGSINRIKMQIEKSRKLIEEFRRSQGIAKI